MNRKIHYKYSLAQRTNRVLLWENREFSRSKELCEITVCYPDFSGETEDDYRKSSIGRRMILEGKVSEEISENY